MSRQFQQPINQEVQDKQGCTEQTGRRVWTQPEGLPAVAPGRETQGWRWARGSSRNLTELPDSTPKHGHHHWNLIHIPHNPPCRVHDAVVVRTFVSVCDHHHSRIPEPLSPRRETWSSSGVTPESPPPRPPGPQVHSHTPPSTDWPTPGISCKRIIEEPHVSFDLKIVC